MHTKSFESLRSLLGPSTIGVSVNAPAVPVAPAAPASNGLSPVAPVQPAVAATPTVAPSPVAITLSEDQKGEVHSYRALAALVAKYDKMLMDALSGVAADRPTDYERTNKCQDAHIDGNTAYYLSLLAFKKIAGADHEYVWDHLQFQIVSLMELTDQLSYPIQGDEDAEAVRKAQVKYLATFKNPRTGKPNSTKGIRALINRVTLHLAHYRRTAADATAIKARVNARNKAAGITPAKPETKTEPVVDLAAIELDVD